MAVPATTRILRTFEDRADALAHFFQRAGEAPRLIAYDDAVGLPLDQALAALEWTAQVGILAAEDLVHAARLSPDSAAIVVERRDGDNRVFVYFGPRMDAPRAGAASHSSLDASIVRRTRRRSFHPIACRLVCDEWRRISIRSRRVGPAVCLLRSGNRGVNTPMWERACCGFTTPHHVDDRWNRGWDRQLASTNDAHGRELTRRNIGTCAVFQPDRKSV